MLISVLERKKADKKLRDKSKEEKYLKQQSSKIHKLRSETMVTKRKSNVKNFDLDNQIIPWQIKINLTKYI